MNRFVCGLDSALGAESDRCDNHTNLASISLAASGFHRNIKHNIHNAPMSFRLEWHFSTCNYRVKVAAQSGNDPICIGHPLRNFSQNGSHKIP